MRHWQSLPSVTPRCTTPLLRRRPRPLRVDVPADVQGGAFPAETVDDAPCQFRCLRMASVRSTFAVRRVHWRNGFTAGVLGHLRVDQRRSGRRASGVLGEHHQRGSSRQARVVDDGPVTPRRRTTASKDSLPSETAALAKNNPAERSHSRHGPPTATLGSSTTPVEQAPRDSPRGSSMRVNGSSQGGGSA